ncbi:hypothetical protein EJB05_42730, partial [Eragrostis curvula]
MVIRRRWQRHAVAALGIAYAATAAAMVAAHTLPSPGDGVSSKGVARNLTQSDGSGNSYHHVWPPMKFGWRIVLGSLIGFLGAVFGSVGGVGGGGIFVTMLALIIGFDPKSSAAMLYHNIKLKHPALDMPLIDYDLTLLIQPMLMLGVSIGVIFNVIFPDWLVTTLLIILFLGTSAKSFLKGVETWKKETIMKKEAAERLMEQTCEDPVHATTVPIRPDDATDAGDPSIETTSFLKNVCWKEFGLLAFVWMAFLALQIAKNYTATCSVPYWVLNSLQIPVAVGVSMFEAYGLMSGKRVLSSKGTQQSTFKPHQLSAYCMFGMVAGVIGGLLGVGGGFILGPLFLELGIPPQVSSATSTFAMMFSSSMTVVEYYLLHRYPVPYAAYVFAVAFIAAIIGQNYVRRLIDWLGRASLIIFILASMIFISAISLGGVGIANIVQKMERHQYMGFESLCN